MRNLPNRIVPVPSLVVVVLLLLASSLEGADAAGDGDDVAMEDDDKPCRIYKKRIGVTEGCETTLAWQFCLFSC